MHLRTHQWLASALAVALCGTAVAARGQDNYAPAAPPSDQTMFASENLNADDANLAKRLADVEKALKKIDDKAKADKEKAASAMSVTPAGRIQVDTSAFTQNGNYLKTTEANGVEFRRLYLGLKGSGFDVLEYKTEFDFAGTNTNNAAGAFPTSVTSGRVQAKDVYLQVNELPMVGHVRVGNFYEPFSLEDVSGDLVTTFMERGNPYLLVPDRHIGVMAFDHILGNENTTWWLGGFCSAGGDGGMLFQESTNHTAAAATGRLTWLPWYDEATEGRGLLHLGVAGTFRDAWGDQFPLASPSLRPEEAHLGKTYAATMNNIDTVNELGSELAFIYGPFSVQSEYVGAFAKDFTGEVHNINSFYIFTSYFLTGENRRYDRANATIARVKPFENFFRVRDENGCVYTGKGAWEVAYRWSWIDFSDAVSATNNGSRFSNHTVGLTWYLNPYTRFMLNDVYSTEQQLNGTLAYLNTVEMRAQIDF
jgi:phosphate-selective porin OprO and OprP